MTNWADSNISRMPFSDFTTKMQSNSIHEWKHIFQKFKDLAIQKAKMLIITNKIIYINLNEFMRFHIQMQFWPAKLLECPTGGA